MPRHSTTKGRHSRRRSGLPYFLAASLLGLLGPALLLSLPSATASAEGFRVTYARVNEWTTGYTAQYTLTNARSRPTRGWTLSFALPFDTRLTNLTNGRYGVRDGRVTVRAQDWNANLARDESVSVIFTVTTYEPQNDPYACVIDDRPCALRNTALPVRAPRARPPLRG